MGVGGYFSTKAERDNYTYLREKIHERMKNTSMISFEGEIYDIFASYGLDHKTTQRMSRCLYVKDLETGDALTEFVMKFGEGIEPISKWRVYISAITIGLSYFVGGLIPMVIKVVYSSLPIRFPISPWRVLMKLYTCLSLSRVWFSLYLGW